MIMETHPLWICVVVCATFLITAEMAADHEKSRNDWYWDSVVTLHIDNHSRLVGKGHTVEELTAMVEDIPVELIQVSALGAVGRTTYPTDIRRHPDLGDWDTLQTWRQVADNLNRRFAIYINTRGLRISQDHPEWTQRNAQGKGKGRHGGHDICVRPSPDDSGALEQIFLPMLREIATRYDPVNIWVDGDHARTWTCYCPNCKAAWKKLTGQDEPPKNPDDADWARWTKFQLQRFDDYRQQMADAIHQCRNECMYTSNHSWRFRAKDPRCVPEFVDTISGDLSHGKALRMTRLSAMQLSAEQHVPYDIMHNIMRVSGEDVSLRRVLQQGALTMACGGTWFLWTPGASITRTEVQQRARKCAEYANARADALRRTYSINQTAVLLSETSWRHMRINAKKQFYGHQTAEHIALSLQDACYAVDMVNEQILRQRLDNYRTVFIANQQLIAPETMAALRQFVDDGGMIVIVGSGLRANEQRNDEIAEWMGVERRGTTENVSRLHIDTGRPGFRSAWNIATTDCQVIASFENGPPAFTRRNVGNGTVAYLAIPSVSYPDADGVMAWTMNRLNIPPALHVRSDARENNLVFSLREKSEKIILHATDLTSYVGGERTVPALNCDIDARPPIEEVKLSVPVSQRPRSVRVVPPTTDISHKWHDGILDLTLANVDVHAAVIIDAAPDTPMQYMPADTPAAQRHVIAQSIDEGFESLDIAEPLPNSIGLPRTQGRTSILPTATAAASGYQSLKFVDHPDAPQPYFPYLVLHPRGLNRDIVYCSMDLKLDKNAVTQIELRETENAREFPVGPSVTFRGAGDVTAAGRDKPLTTIPADKWFRTNIIFDLNQPDTYELRVQIPGNEQLVFDDLPFKSENFWKCGWVGIVGQGEKQATFYVDNLAIGRVDTMAAFEALQRPEIAPPPSKEPETPNEKGLYGHWKFDEGEGRRAADSSGRHNHARVTTEWTDGKIGGAVQLMQQTDKNVLVEDCQDLRFGESSFTIAFWLKPESLQSSKGYRRLINKDDFPHTWWNIDVKTDGRVEMEMHTAEGDGGTTVSNGHIPLNEWTHIAIVVDREHNETRYYFNGRLDSKKQIPQPFDGSLDVAHSHIYVGSNFMKFIGAIDELRIYRRTLHHEQLRDIARGHAKPE